MLSGQLSEVSSTLYSGIQAGATQTSQAAVQTAVNSAQQSIMNGMSTLGKQAVTLSTIGGAINNIDVPATEAAVTIGAQVKSNPDNGV